MFSVMNQSRHRSILLEKRSTISRISVNVWDSDINFQHRILGVTGRVASQDLPTRDIGRYPYPHHSRYPVATSNDPRSVRSETSACGKGCREGGGSCGRETDAGSVEATVLADLIQLQAQRVVSVVSCPLTSVPLMSPVVTAEVIIASNSQSWLV